MDAPTRHVQHRHRWLRRKTFLGKDRLSVAAPPHQLPSKQGAWARRMNLGRIYVLEQLGVLYPGLSVEAYAEEAQGLARWVQRWRPIKKMHYILLNKKTTAFAQKKSLQ